MTNTLTVFFATIPIPLSQVFLFRSRVFAMVNLRPFVPGHVLLCTRRVTPKLQDLSPDEVTDLFATAHEICSKLEVVNQGKYEIILQNGEEAGQTVKHVHLHLISKDRIAGLERDSDKARSAEDMAVEAEKYRPFFEPFSQ
jgi:bis(5'-adenosyl)-triphosphatase